MTHRHVSCGERGAPLASVRMNDRTSSSAGFFPAFFIVGGPRFLPRTRRRERRHGFDLFETLGLPARGVDYREALELD